MAFYRVLVWHPIDTYAHKGRAVLLAVTSHDGKSRFTGEALYYPDEPHSHWYWAQENPGDYHGRGAIEGYCTITHWAEMPEAPTL